MRIGLDIDNVISDFDKKMLGEFKKEDKIFYIGIRFHLECLYEKDEIHRKIFIEFINACKKYRKW